MSDSSEELNKFLDVMDTLLGPEGCQWDRKQTHKSLIPYLLEEAHEVIEAINEGNQNKLKEELGDLLLHIVFQAKLSEKEDEFKFSDSIRSIREKMIRRHPHIFSDVEVENTKDIKQNWEKIKKKEGRKSLMEGLPKSLPSLLFARRIQERAAEQNFDWKKVEPIWEKIDEETQELKSAIAKKNQDEIEEEFGDLLFSLVNLSRFLNINPEEALKITNRKFMSRFQKIEKHIAHVDKDFANMSLNELDSLWNKAKDEERS
ncbi:MAG: nucleoside triphosphate pyrophosphohydrolase [Candidatus Marinimicrobia bacterium]|nr:nucleoside triphosphate pyrophosphohydrolase [Candidatus Neomarinimicrobiota bacterium]